MLTEAGPSSKLEFANARFGRMSFKGLSVDPCLIGWREPVVMATSITVHTISFGLMLNVIARDS